jgi:CHAT domain-containing protein
MSLPGLDQRRKLMWAGLCVWLSTCTILFASTSARLDEGQRAFDRGAFADAAASWERSADLSRSQRDTNGTIRANVKLATAWQRLGQQRRAAEILQETLTLAEHNGNATQITWVKSRLGAALIQTLQLDQADKLLRESLESAQNAHDQPLVASILNDRGNLLTLRQKGSEALASFEQSAEVAAAAGERSLQAEASCNAAATAARAKLYPKAEQLNGDAVRLILALPPGHWRDYLLLTAAQTDRAIKFEDKKASESVLLRAKRSLEQALKPALERNDMGVVTYALGYMAEMYEADQQLSVAEPLARRAIATAQQAQLPDALFRWEWLLARLLRAQGETDAAIAEYRHASQTLQPIRNDLALGYGNAASHPTFREATGPLYFELADLLLAQATTNTTTTEPLLREARDTVEQLKAVELEDYFRDDCVNVQRSRTKSLDQVDPHTAVIYLIPLPDRTELLLGLASSLHRVRLNVGVEALSNEVREFRRNLETRTSYAYLEQAHQLYDWIVRPIRPLLQEHQVDTLVFLPDGTLRTIPFASLHDGERFLIQDFAVAVAPGLSLVEPHAVESGKGELLLTGLSKSVQGYPALDFVPEELQSIEPLYRSQVLLNEQFTLNHLKQQLTEEQYSIVHIASHGQFDRDIRNTFVLTYDDKVTLNGLESLIRPSQYRGKPVELLVLSACQTAAGDDRAALGLAGVAVKAGARSAMATLWFVNDESTAAVVSEVYSQLRKSPRVSKARALQAAQIKLLNDRRYHHPCYWSPYLMIGNWL